MYITIIIIVVIVLLCSIRQVQEYERGILFQLGKYKKILNPGPKTHSDRKNPNHYFP